MRIQRMGSNRAETTKAPVCVEREPLDTAVNYSLLVELIRIEQCRPEKDVAYCGDPACLTPLGTFADAYIAGLFRSRVMAKCAS